MIGRTLDRYRIESKLGEGAMGVVFAARDTRLDRLVAIKVLPADAVASADRRRRFVQEAKAASALNHPGIVVVHDIRSDDGVDFIVMELVAGRTLDRVIPAHGLPIDQALRYAIAIADAVAAAHGAGIVHRDLKPSNVMVTDDGRLKVLDFGLAKLLDDGGEGSDVATRSAAATTPGTVLGSAAYMSPEQAEGRTVDARADVFSFGVMLYELLTGRRPFIGDTVLTTIARILHDEPVPPSRLTPLVSPELDRTVLRSLRKDRDRRFQSMADLKVGLQDLATESRTGSGASPALSAGAPPARRSPWPWLAAATVAVLAAGAYLTMERERPPDDAAPLVAVPLTSAPGTKRTPSFSLDGTQVAYSWTGADQDNVDVYVQQVGADAPLRLTTDPGNDASPTWSPDGRTIAFLRRREASPQLEVRLIAPLGGPERKLLEIAPRSNVRTQTLAWCADSSCVVVADTTGPGKPNALFVVAVASGDKRQLTEPDTTFGDCDPAVSPDGRWLIFRREAAPFSGALYRLALGPDMRASGEPIRATTTQLGAYNARWTPDSREILFAARSALWRLAFTPGAEPRRLPFVGQDGAMPATSSVRPGDPARLVYVRSFADTNIVGVQLPAPGAPATTPPVATIASTRRDDSPHISADGRRVTFVSDRSGQPEVWMSDITGAAAVQLTSMGANPGFPRWTPDGASVVFQSNPDGNGDVFIVSADGGRPRNLTSHPSSDVFPSVSRDGRSIYFSSTRSGEAAIWKMPVDGGTPVRVSAGVSQLAIESPDGADVYYVQSGVAIGAGLLMRQAVAGGPAVKLLDDVATTSFDVIDRGIYYIERAAAATRLRFFDFGSQRSTVIGDTLGTLAFGFTASPDGRTILFARVDSAVDDLMLVENFR